jgi:hypothetical protein
MIGAEYDSFARHEEDDTGHRNLAPDDAHGGCGLING